MKYLVLRCGIALWLICGAGLTWADTSAIDSADGAGPRTWTVNVAVRREGAALSEVDIKQSKAAAEMSGCRYPDWGVAVSSRLASIKDGMMTFEVLCAPGKQPGAPARQ
ncbi:MAG: hypothetical protein KKB02_08150 [Alphaproteobacteria bacterium]|nr:hypothetical protein [Alphaproteobacteria bacterium]